MANSKQIKLGLSGILVLKISYGWLFCSQKEEKSHCFSFKVTFRVTTFAI